MTGERSSDTAPAVPGESPHRPRRFNPGTQGFRVDPYPEYAWLREEEPVHKWFYRVWVVTRYSDVLQLLQSSQAMSSQWELSEHLRKLYLAEPQRQSYERWRRWLLYLDGHAHTRIRRILAEVISPAAMRALQERIEHLVDELLDQVVGGQLELIQQVAVPLPAYTICETLGIPRRDFDQVTRWSIELTRTFDPTPQVEAIVRGHEATEKLSAYLGDLIEERKVRPGDDALTRFVPFLQGEDGLSREELISTCIFVLWAGHETTSNLIGNGMCTLLRHPEALALLREEPHAIPTAVDEMARFESPVQTVYRRATCDQLIGGKMIREGDHVLAVLAAANRDPRRFPSPDAFDPKRADNRHLGFGYGSHYCVGAPLARLEASIFFRRFLQRFPRVQLAADTSLQWRSHWLIRGLESLPLAVA